MDKIELINRISALRIKSNLSARALSMQIGMNEGYINRLECKKDFVPSFEVLNAILQVCNCTFEEFFYNKTRNYNHDMEIIALIEDLSEEKKNALKILLKNK